MTSNMEELERNTQEKQLFDPIKAKAQIDVYKEIYRLEEFEALPEEERNQAMQDVRNKDGALKILKTASDNDVAKIKKFFEKADATGQSEIEQ